MKDSFFLKDVINQSLWNFELSGQESMNVPIWIFIACQKRALQDSQNLKKDTFCRLPLTSAQCNIGTEKFPDSGMLLNYDDDAYSQTYV